MHFKRPLAPHAKRLCRRSSAEQGLLAKGAVRQTAELCAPRLRRVRRAPDATLNCGETELVSIQACRCPVSLLPFGKRPFDGAVAQWKAVAL